MKQRKLTESCGEYDYNSSYEQETEVLKQEHLEQKKDVLIDSFGRIARKLRISVTDRCNMHCKYCMPQSKVQ